MYSFNRNFTGAIVTRQNIGFRCARDFTDDVVSNIRVENTEFVDSANSVTELATSSDLSEATSEATYELDVTNATVIVNVPVANLRIGPGTNYSIIGTATFGTSLSVVARTGDSSWYLVEITGTNQRTWISTILVNTFILDSPISTAVTIPAPTNITAQYSSLPTQVDDETDLQVGSVRYGYDGCWSDGTPLSLYNRSVPRGVGISVRIIPDGEPIEWVVRLGEGTGPEVMSYSTGNGAEVYREQIVNGQTYNWWDKWCEIRLLNGKIGWLQYDFLRTW